MCVVYCYTEYSQNITCGFQTAMGNRYFTVYNAARMC